MIIIFFLKAIACTELDSGESRFMDNHSSVYRIRHAFLPQAGMIVADKPDFIIT